MSKSIAVEQIRETSLSEALSERYLAYALSTIVSRSLPDVRDGLKPVHRRLLYAMRMLKLDPASGFKKCARVVGDVIGKYHPHGDAAVYEAMVRLAQEFAVRYPLVEGQGNFGNIDGDNAAAMRYTEARLTEVAQAIMEGLNEDCVDFRPTYDGEEEEPIVMPAAFPNLLANGSAGIAVGMATNIPPHNAEELCDALLHIIKKPDCEVSDLMKYVQGPDFPTGGVITEDASSILNAYETGKGSFRVRAKWIKEDLSHGLYQIIVTEVPYQVQKAKLIENIANLIINKRVPLLADVRDESTDIVRIVLEPKNRSVEPEIIMEQLYKQTELESRFSLNMNVLDMGKEPKVMSLKEVLAAFIAHRLEVLVRRSQHRLDKINHRMEVLEGYLKAYLNLDEVIRIIREEDEPKVELMKTFKLTDVQAEAILNMRLRSLRRLEEMEIKTEHSNLATEKASLEELLADEVKRYDVISKEIKETKVKFGKKTELGKRRTEITSAPEIIDVPIEAFIEKEAITVIISEKGWVRAVKGHAEAGEEFKFKDGDELKFKLHAQTTDKILLFDTSGKFFTISANDIQRGRGFGQPIRLMVDLANEDDIVCVKIHEPQSKLLVAAASGKGFIVAEEQVIAQTKVGKKILNLDDKDVAKLCIEVEGDYVAVIGDNRRLLVYPASEIPEMSRGKGVILQRYQNGGISDAKFFNFEEGLAYPSGNGTRIETELMAWQGKRAQTGRLPPVGFPRTNKFTK